MSSEIKATKKMKKINEKICTMQQKNTCKKVADLVKSVKGTVVVRSLLLRYEAFML